MAKYSYQWLKELTGLKLSAKNMAEVLSLHAFETTIGVKVGQDTILDAEVLPNRAHDCFSHVGVAKEILSGKGKAAQNIKLKKFPFKESAPQAKDSLVVQIRNSKLCPRYSARVMSGVKVGSSPKWLRDRLKTCGLQSINNIVDATNYAMLEMGQPLHAFDATKLAREARGRRKIIVRTAKEGEKITTIDGQKFKLEKGMLLISDPKKPLAIAGIKGGTGSEITKDTKTIVIESANFDPVNISQTSSKLGLVTDASVRFSGGLTPVLTSQALDRVASIIQKVAGGKMNRGIVDAYPNQVIQRRIAISKENIRDLLGIEVKGNEVKAILERMGFEVKPISFKKELAGIIKLAKSLKDKAKYKYGASTTFSAPGEFDCSSFIKWLYRQMGINIPRVTIEQIDLGQEIAKKNIKPGDLIFTKGLKPHVNEKHPKGVGHVGLYIGNRKIIHISSKAKTITEESLAKFLGKDFRGIRRVLPQKDEALLVKAPFERLDIEQEVDLVEEIIRIKGFDSLDSAAPENLIVAPEINLNRHWVNAIRNVMAAAGFWETYNYSFISEKDSQIFLNREEQKELVALGNPISNEYKYLQPSLLINLVKAAALNKTNSPQVKFFETGKMWRKKIREYQEKSALAVIFSAPLNSNQSFYEVKGVADTLFEKLGIDDVWYDDWQPKIKGHLSRIWQAPEVAEIKISKNEHIGILGRLEQKLINEYGVESALYSLEVNLDKLTEHASEEVEYLPVSKYPAAIRDLAVLVPARVPVDMVQGEIETIGGKLLVDSDLFDIYEGEHLSANKKSLAFRLIFQSPTKTLSDNEINKLISKIIKRVRTKGWEVRE
jgi:phenylalanyl-tRNA synthetase beta subunit